MDLLHAQHRGYRHEGLEHERHALAVDNPCTDVPSLLGLGLEHPLPLHSYLHRRYTSPELVP